MKKSKLGGISMAHKTIPIKSHEYEIGELQKYVNVSQNGHGIVTYRIDAYRATNIPMIIQHLFGSEEGPPGSQKLPGLKAMDRCCKSKGSIALSTENAFRIRPYGFEVKKAIWRDITTNDKGLGFSLDVNKTFHEEQNDLRYMWMWSRKDMFVPKDSLMPCYTQVKIEHPTKMLYYQVAFGKRASLDGNPVLIKITAAGKEIIIKKLQIKPEHHEDYGLFEMNEQDLLCKYYWVAINKPDLGATYKIVWRTK
ncbi:MAG: hypothetical protein WCG51_06740, partial [Elusimicrobiota bacterium]